MNSNVFTGRLNSKARSDKPASGQHAFMDQTKELGGKARLGESRDRWAEQRPRHDEEQAEAKDNINIESFGAFGKLVQELTLNWRPVCCFFVPHLMGFAGNVWSEFPSLYSSAVPIFSTASAL